MSETSPASVRKILHVGALPPPIGGVTVHCSRILRAQLRLGHDVAVVDPRPGQPSTEGQITGSQAVTRLLQARRDGAIVFLQYSGSTSLTKTLRVAAAALAAPASRLALVQHSGGYDKVLNAKGPTRLVHRWLIRRAATCLCFSSRLEQVMQEAGARQTLRGASFITDATIEDLASQESAGQRAPVIVSSGYRTPIYRYEELVDMWKALTGEHPDAELHLYVYGNTDEDYWPKIRMAADGESGIRIFEDCDQEPFLRAVGNAKVYVRNTSHDSYGVAVAEALFLGTQVVATNVCDRPSGARLFDVGDLGALEQLVSESLSTTSDIAHLGWGESGDTAYEEIVELLSD